MSAYSYLAQFKTKYEAKFDKDQYSKMDGFIVSSANDLPVPRDFALLKIWISPDHPDLANVYRQHIDTHNEKTLKSVYPDAGFDIFIPEEVVFRVPFQNQMIPLGIKMEMVYFSPQMNGPISTGCDMRPRSSISKSSLMLSNHVGTIDSGYRGELIGAFRWLPVTKSNYIVDKHTRLLQIVHPTLCPILVVLVDSEEELSSTERGTGGFGSTGVKGQLAT
jgi:dUTP pyrophosphatase